MSPISKSFEYAAIYHLHVDNFKYVRSFNTTIPYEVKNLKRRQIRATRSFPQR